MAETSCLGVNIMKLCNAFSAVACFNFNMTKPNVDEFHCIIETLTRKQLS